MKTVLTRRRQVLTQDQADRMRMLSEQGVTGKNIGIAFGLNQSVVSRIKGSGFSVEKYLESTRSRPKQEKKSGASEAEAGKEVGGDITRSIEHSLLQVSVILGNMNSLLIKIEENTRKGGIFNR